MEAFTQWSSGSEGWLRNVQVDESVTCSREIFGAKNVSSRWKAQTFTTSHGLSQQNLAYFCRKTVSLSLVLNFNVHESS
jgi:hypothetical protein